MWQASRFGGWAMLQQCQGCARACYWMAVERLQVFDRVPFLLARLDEPGVRNRCLAQYRSCAARLHHRVSFDFLDVDGSLFNDVMSMDDDGSNMSPQLTREAF